MPSFAAEFPKGTGQLSLQPAVLDSDKTQTFMAMPNDEKVDVIIYRIREKGLEVFLTHDEQGLTADETSSERLRTQSHIELDTFTTDEGETRKALAVEADWHELPSLRALLYEDYRVAKEKARQHFKNLFDLDKGAFVAIKEALKRALPAQYAYLKELKEVLSDKNQTKSI